VLESVKVVIDRGIILRFLNFVFIFIFVLLAACSKTDEPKIVGETQVNQKQHLLLKVVFI
jgi:hypothetical protein